MSGRHGASIRRVVTPAIVVLAGPVDEVVDVVVLSQFDDCHKVGTSALMSFAAAAGLVGDLDAWCVGEVDAALVGLAAGLGSPSHAARTSGRARIAWVFRMATPWLHGTGGRLNDTRAWGLAEQLEEPRRGPQP